MSDDSGHLYFIPKAQKARFIKLLEADEDQFGDAFDQHRLDSHLSCYIFTLEGEDP